MIPYAMSHSPRLQTTLEPGALFAERYKVLALLGRGGMGSIYHAYDSTTAREVALKIPSTLRGDGLKSFAREAELHASLSSPHIARVYSYSLAPGTAPPHLALEYLPGKSIAQILESRTIPAISPRLSWLRQIATALHEIHCHGILHRDITPGNVMILNDGGSAKLLDFGAAIRIDQQTKDDSSRMIGTPHYMSPEQYRGSTLDVRSDIYSFGVLSYEILTGERAFELAHDYEEFLQAHHLRLRHLAAKIPSVREKNPRVSRALSTMVQVCMQKKRANRYESCVELIGRLEQELNCADKPSTISKLARLILGPR